MQGRIILYSAVKKTKKKINKIKKTKKKRKKKGILKQANFLRKDSSRISALSNLKNCSTIKVKQFDIRAIF